MRTTTWTGLLLTTAVLAAGGCSQDQDDSSMLRGESQNLRERLAQRESALDAANIDRRELEMANSQLRRELDDATLRMGELSDRSTGFEGIDGVDSVYGDGEVTLSIASDVLFDSGKVELKTGAKQSLNQVAAVMGSQYQGNQLRICGHTDSDPIRKSGWTSNFHLGAERAYTVMQYLASRSITNDQMHIASYGPNKSLGTKQASRRVEIIVLLDS